jgi:2-iminobutanoate/2-iminopropanoate deaminase
MKRNVVKTAAAPAAIGPYSQAITVDLGHGRTMIFCSGQIALDPATGALADGDVAAQTRQALSNLAAVLAAANATLADIVRTTIFLADMQDFATVNATYGEYFPTAPPARATVQAARLPRDARVEIDAIAVVGTPVAS